MCCDTKAKIAATVREIMLKRPVSKITVQDVMEQANMTRQSFYYHFQDIFQVLEWDVTQNFGASLAFRHEQSFEDWCMQLLQLIQENHLFYRKVVNALGRNKVLTLLMATARPQMERLLFDDGKTNSLSEDASFVIDFASQLMLDYFINLILCGSRIDLDKSRHNVQVIVQLLRNCGMPSEVPQSNLAC